MGWESSIWFLMREGGGGRGFVEGGLAHGEECVLLGDVVGV